MTQTASAFRSARSALRFAQLSAPGSIFFVDSVNGSANGGGSPDAACLTLAQAQTAATTGRGDTIYVAPNHVETFAGAAALTVSKNNLSIIGLGLGALRPTITWATSTAAQMIVSGASILFKNIIFDFTGVDAVVAAIKVTGADVAFEDCLFITNSATAGVVLGILTAATATRFRVENCTFLGPATNSGTTTTADIKHEVGINFVLRNNFHIGKKTQAVLNATTILGGLIEGNKYHIYTGTKAISLAAGTTGCGFNNRITVPSGTAPIVGAGFSWAGNIYTTEGLTIGTPTAGAF